MTGSAAASAFTDDLDTRADEIVGACIECGRCAEACPMLAPAGIDEAPEALAAGIIGLLRGADASPASRHWAEVCTGSGKCIPACEHGINPRFMMRLAKLRLRRAAPPAEIAEESRRTFRTMARGVRMLSRLQLPAATLERVNPKRLRRPVREAPPEVVFYTGCNVLKTPHIALLCLDVLDALAVRYEVMGGPSHCCGVFQFNAGEAGAAGRVGFSTIERLGERLEAPGAEVLSWCPSCQTQLGEITLPSYRRAAGTSPFDLVPFIAFLHRHLERLRPRFVHRVEKRVALHERPVLPEVVSGVRAILAAIPGIELVELDVPRVGTMGNSMSVLPEYKASLREREFRLAADAGVTTLATVFHACHREICHFEKDVSFEILNFMELVGEAMGIRHDDLYKRLKMMEDVDAVIAEMQEMVELHGLDVEDLRESLYVDMLAAQPLGIRAATPLPAAVPVRGPSG